MGVTLLLLVAMLPPQDPDRAVLTPGVTLQGEVARDDVELTDQDLIWVQNRTFLPLRAKRFRLEVAQAGRYSIVLDAPLFQAIVVLRDEAGRLVGTNFCDGTDWLQVDLAAGRGYQLDCCSTLGATGAFTLQLLPASRSALPERIARMRSRVAERKQALGEGALQVAAALDSLGYLLYQQPDYAGALDCMQQALPIWRQHCGESSLMVAHGHHQIAMQLRGLGRYGEARTHLQTCLRLREAGLGSGHVHALQCLNWLGVVLQDSNDLGAAADCFERVLAAQPGEDRRVADLHLTALQNLAYVTKEEGKFTAAKALATRALAAREARFGPDDLGIPWVLGTLGSCEFGLGNYAQAEIHARRALAIRQKGLPADHADTATAHNNLGVVLLERGRAAEAEAQFVQCLRSYRNRLGDHWYTATALGNLGDCLLQQGRLEDGEQHLRQAQALLEKLGLGSHPGTAKILRNLAEADFYRRDWSAAAEGFRRVREMLERGLGPLHPETLGVRMKHAYVLRLGGRHEGAAAEYPAIQRDLLAVYGPDHPTANTMAEGTAILLATAGRNAEAFAMAVEAVGGRWRHLGGELVASSSEHRFRDAAALRRSFDVLLTIANRDRQAASLDAAFEWQAAARGVVYRHVLRQRERIGEQSTDAQRTLQNDLEACRAQLAKLAYGAATSDPEDHARQLAALHDRKSELEGLLGASLGLRVHDERLVLADFARRLPADAVLVDFAFHVPYRFAEVVEGKLVTEEGLLPERCFAWVVTAGAAHVQRIDLGPGEPIARAVEDFVQDMAKRRGRPVRRDGDQQKSPNDVLRALLWDPVAELVGTSRLVFVAADRELAKVPLAALQRADGRFLLEAHTFVCVQDPISLDRDLRRGPAARAAAPGLLALGAVRYDGQETAAADVATASAATPAQAAAAAAAGPVRGGYETDWGTLPKTRDEVEAIEALHRRRFAEARRLLLTDAAATKARLVAEVAGFQILHLATHGFFEPAGLPSLWEQELQQVAAAGAGGGAITTSREVTGYPPGLLAGLVLAGANRETDRGAGVLTAEEVNGLDLARCELVVLSACETALGEMRGGEGMLGLRRAFHEAGARTVVSSLWSVVDDSTARLMRSFYENLWQHGLPPAEALRRAQLAMLELQRRRGAAQVLPSAWGAFVLSGDWR